MSVGTEVEPLTTADGRYIVVRGRLWRKSNPALPEAARAELVRELMAARSALCRARLKSQDARVEARQRVDVAKVSLGERGPVWWEDGSPDYNRHLAVNTPYRDWYLESGRTDDE